MPYTIEWEPDAGILVGIGSGILTLQDAVRGAREVWQNPDWTGKPVVWDFRGAKLQFSTPDVETIAQFVRDRSPVPPRSRVAFVTVRNVDFGLIRMFGALRLPSATEVRVFRDFGEAVLWARTGRG